MPGGLSKDGNHGRRERPPLGVTAQYAWKERIYPVPTPSRKGFRWKASALLSLEKLHKTQVTGQPATIVVPALYNFMPAESLALGWLNEIDALQKIRHRIIAAAQVTGWDVFTFHTQHNLDPYFNSTIATVRDTWLREGSLKMKSIAEAQRRFGKVYEYHRVQARLVENLVFQSSLMDWLTDHADNVPLRFHVIGTALLSALVWSRSLSFDAAVGVAMKLGRHWDESLAAIAVEDLKRQHADRSVDNLGWMQFARIRQILEGGAALSLGMSSHALADADPPLRPFWFSPTAKDEPVLLQTAPEMRSAMKTLNLASWSPGGKAPPNHLIGGGMIRGWLVSPLHPMAAACRWSVHNYLLATPKAALLFLDHIASLGRIPDAAPDSLQKRLPVSRIKVTGP